MRVFWINSLVSSLRIFDLISFLGKIIINFFLKEHVAYIKCEHEGGIVNQWQLRLNNEAQFLSISICNMLWSEEIVFQKVLLEQVILSEKTKSCGLGVGRRWLAIVMNVSASWSHSGVTACWLYKDAMLAHLILTCFLIVGSDQGFIRWDSHN